MAECTFALLLNIAQLLLYTGCVKVTRFYDSNTPLIYKKNWVHVIKCPLD
jgi:hypothetical protein